MPSLDELPAALLLKAAEVRVHHIQRHLHGIEVKTVCLRDLQHAEMDARILVPGEANVANFPRLLRLQQRLHRAARGKNAIGIFEANDLVKLHEIDMIGLQALERFVDLLRAASFVRPSILVIRKAFWR